MGDAAYDAWAEKAKAHIEKTRLQQDAMERLTDDDGPWRLSAEEIAWVKERYEALIPSGMALEAVEQATQETANRFPDNHTPKRLLMEAVISGPSVFKTVTPTDGAGAMSDENQTVQAWRWLRATVLRLREPPQYDGWYERLEGAMEEGGRLFPGHVDTLKRLPYFMTYSPDVLDALIRQQCPEALVRKGGADDHIRQTDA